MDNTLFDTITYRDHNIELHYDYDPLDPQEYIDPDQFLCYYHRDFWVEGDKNIINEDLLRDYFNNEPEAKEELKGFWVFPVYAYIHSSVSLSLANNTYPFTCPWDTSLAGAVFIGKKNFRLKKSAYEQAGYIVKDYNNYLGGAMGYISDYGSCWNFYDKEEMIWEAESEIDYHIAEKTKKHIDYLKGAIKNNVPLMYRKQLTT